MKKKQVKLIRQFDFENMAIPAITKYYKSVSALLEVLAKQEKNNDLKAPLIKLSHDYRDHSERIRKAIRVY